MLDTLDKFFHVKSLLEGCPLLDGRYKYLIQLEISYPFGNTLILAPFVLTPQITLKRQGTLRLGKIMILLLIAIIPQTTQKDNSNILSLIMIVPQIMHERVISQVHGSQESHLTSKIFEPLKGLLLSDTISSD